MLVPPTHKQRWLIVDTTKRTRIVRYSSGFLSVSRRSLDLQRVRATDPRPCPKCGKIYRSAHTLRTHLEDKHTICPGYRCVLCGTVAKSRNSLHSHMSRQHRGISTKDLPVLPMPAPFDPELASRWVGPRMFSRRVRQKRLAPPNNVFFLQTPGEGRREDKPSGAARPRLPHRSPTFRRQTGRQERLFRRPLRSRQLHLRRQRPGGPDRVARPLRRRRRRRRPGPRHVAAPQPPPPPPPAAAELRRRLQAEQVEFERADVRGGGEERRFGAQLLEGAVPGAAGLRGQLDGIGDTGHVPAVHHGEQPRVRERVVLTDVFDINLSIDNRN